METDTIIRVHEDEGIRTALVTTIGPKFAHMIWADSSGMKLHKIRLAGIRYEVLDYPVKRAKVMFRKMGKNFGITKSARRALRA